MHHRATILTAAALFACAAPLGGCWTPITEPVVNVNPTDYLHRNSPENVLHNIVTSYVWMNLEEYLDCMSEDFEFYPDEADVQDPDVQLPPVWYKLDEQNMHSNMFDDGSNVESIRLALTVLNIVYDQGVPEDDLDDTCTCQVQVDLRVNLREGVTFLATAPSEFSMRVDTDQTGPGGELWWEILEWHDLGDAGRVSGSRSSWGAIKALYR